MDLSGGTLEAIILRRPILAAPFPACSKLAARPTSTGPFSACSELAARPNFRCPSQLVHFENHPT